MTTKSTENQKDTARKEYDEPKTNTQPERFMNKLHEQKVLKTVHGCTWQKVRSSKAD